jgi:hypothetical protein
MWRHRRAGLRIQILRLTGGCLSRLDRCKEIIGGGIGQARNRPLRSSDYRRALAGCACHDALPPHLSLTDCPRSRGMNSPCSRRMDPVQGHNPATLAELDHARPSKSEVVSLSDRLTSRKQQCRVLSHQPSLRAPLFFTYRIGHARRGWKLEIKLVRCPPSYEPACSVRDRIGDGVV